ELRIIIDRDKAIEYGLTVAQVYAVVAEKLSTASQATTLSGAEKDYAVYVSNEENTTLTREDLESVTVAGTNADGEKVDVPLSDIASFESAKGFSSISRSEQSRYVTVSAAIAEGYNVGLVSADIEEQLEKYDMPAGYSFEMGGENEATMEAMGQLMLMLVLAIAFMYLIMVAQFQSLLSPFIIMFTIPLAFTGGFAALYLTGTEVSVIAMIGFVMLSGIIVNNGIVIIDYMNQLRERGMSKVEAIVEAGRTRLRPVLMTASTTVFAMIGMVFSQDMGASMAKPMALVTIGGLVYGTLLTLIVVPCVYDMFIRKGKEETSELKLEISED
ncbi:MAG: efflux RND transporter permease subunit, partial [Peptococcaceae bacterium]|nr:efflux RND transporter permease subunit [Peptococcaceae bacterium]